LNRRHQSPEKKTLHVAFYCGSGRAGYKDGRFEEAMFHGVHSFLPLADGSVLVSETNNSSIRLIKPLDNTVSTLNKNVCLHPKGMCEYGDSVLVCDSGHHRIRLVSRDGKRCTFFAGSGNRGGKDAKIQEAQFDNPSGVAVASDGTILVADTNNHRIRRIDLKAQRVTTLAGSKEGFQDGKSKEALFKFPVAIHVDSDGSFLVADSGNNCIRRISKDMSHVSTIINKGDNTPASPLRRSKQASLASPEGLCVGVDGTIYVCDTDNHCVRKIINDKVVTFAGTRTAGSKNGKAKLSEFHSPKGIVAMSEQGNTVFLVADSGNNAIRIIFPAYPKEGEPVSPESPIKVIQTPKTPSNKSPLKSELMSNMISISSRLRTARHQDYQNKYKGFWDDKRFEKPAYYDLVYQYEEEITNIFVYYTNALRNHIEAVELSGVQFLKFVKDSKMLDDRVVPNEVFIIYTEATKHAPSFKMNIDDFINGLCLVACLKFGEPHAIRTVNDLIAHDVQVSEHLRKLLVEYVLPNAGKVILDPSPDELSERAVITLWSKHEQSLHKIFIHYATSKRTLREATDWTAHLRGLNTLNIEEFYNFAKDFEIFPNFGSKIQLSRIFQSCCCSALSLLDVTSSMNASVLRSPNHSSITQTKFSTNISQNLHSNYTAGGDTVSLDFYEFLECLGRIALLRYGEPPLSEVYTTTVSKIEALLEHMHLSKGRAKFASETGGRLFRNIESPIKKEVAKHVKSQFTGRKNRGESPALHYSTYSMAKKSVKDTSFNVSNVSNVSSIALDRENVISSAKDVTLYIYDDPTNSWSFVCSGNLQLSSTTSTETDKTQFYLHIVSQSGQELSSKLSIRNLPHVQTQELFHVWRKGNSSLFPDENAYGIQFKTVQESKKFQQEYDHITLTEKKTAYNKPLLSRMNSAPVKNSPARQNSLLDSPPSRSRSPLTTSMLDHGTPGNAFSKSPARKIAFNRSRSPSPVLRPSSSTSSLTSPSSPLTKLQRTKKSVKVVNLEQDDDSFLLDESHESTIEPQVSRILPATSFIFDYEQLLVEIVSSCIDKHSQNKIDQELVSSPRNSQVFGASPKRKINTPTNSYQTAVQYSLTRASEELKRDIIDHVRFVTGLSLSGNLDAFLSRKYTEQDQRIEEAKLRDAAAKSIVSMDHTLCSRIQSVKSFYEIISKCLDNDTYYAECYIRDGLGVNTFNYAQSFCVVEQEEYWLDVYIAGEKFKYAALSQITKLKAYINDKEVPRQTVQLVFEEERLVAKITIPITVPSDIDAERTGHASFTREMPDRDIAELSGPVRGQSLSIRLSFVVKEDTQGKLKRKLYHILLDVPLSVFTVQSSMDRVYAPIKEKLSLESASLPTHLRSLFLFSKRKIDRYTSTTFNKD
jgi:sugar lactone lactonase YvrE